MTSWPTIALLVMLLAASAFFSGSETALLSLQRETVQKFRESGRRRFLFVATLLDRQRDLLATILFGNMVVNVLFYSITAMTAYGLAARGERTLAGLVSVGGLFAVVICGEVAPKAAALSFNRRIAPLVSIPLYAVFVVLQPVTRAIGPIVRGATVVALRAIGTPGRISREELSMLVETTRSQGHIPPQEGEMIEEVMSLGETRVRDVMVPRVDLIACASDAAVDDLVGIFRRTRRTKIPVYDGDIDNIIGIAYVKAALLDGAKTLADITGKPYFVPEAKIAEDLLYEFQKNRITVAVVVDEYGGTAGIVTLADIVGEIVGPLGDEYEAPEELVEEIRPGYYRLAGDLSIRDWEELFGVDVENERLSTLAGLIVMLLGRMARTGDTVTHRNVRFTVEEVRRHRIVSVLAGLADDNGAAGGLRP